MLSCCLNGCFLLFKCPVGCDLCHIHSYLNILVLLITKRLENGCVAVNTIAQDIASLPVRLEKRKVIQQSVTQFDGTQDKVRRETWVDASAEPEFKLLSKPNLLQSAVEFWMLVVIDLLATGDAYIYVDQGNPDEDQLEDTNSARNRLQQALTRGRSCKARALYRLSSSLVQPVISTEGNKIT